MPKPNRPVTRALTIAACAGAASLADSTSGQADILPVVLSGSQVPVLEPGAVYSDFISVKTNRWGDLALCARFAGTGVDTANDVGIVSLPITGAPSLVAREGSTIAGLPVGALLGAVNYHIQLHDSRDITFRGSISGPGFNPASDFGVYSTLPQSPLGTFGYETGPTPDMPGTTLRYLDIPATNAGDTYLVNARVEGPMVDPDLDTVVYRVEPGNAPAQLVASGLAPDPQNPDAVIESVDEARLDIQGNAWMLVTLTGPDVDSSNDEALIVTTPAGTTKVIARKGGEVIGFPVEAYYNNINTSYDLDDQGNVYFNSSLTRPGSAGSFYTIFRADTTGNPVAIVSSNQQAPGLPTGVTYFQPIALDTHVSPDGRLAFESSLSGSPASANAALFIDLGEGPASVARKGDPAPGPHHPASYADFNTIRTNRTGGAAFRATLNTIGDALLGVTPDAQVVYIVGVTDTIDVDPSPTIEDLRTVADVVELGSIELQDSGLLYFRLAFTDGTSGIFGTQLHETCAADVNMDGMLTPADFSAWLAAFNASAPECDQNADGACTPADFTAWIANYNMGC